MWGLNRFGRKFPLLRLLQFQMTEKVLFRFNDRKKRRDKMLDGKTKLVCAILVHIFFEN